MNVIGFAMRGLWRAAKYVVGTVFKRRTVRRVRPPVSVDNAFVYRFVAAQDRTVHMLMLEHRNGRYGPPGGLIDAPETSWQCAKREWREETGYRISMTYTETLKFSVKHSRVYLQQLDTLAAMPSPGPPGPCSIGSEIRHIAHFSLPQLKCMRDDTLPGQIVRFGARKSLTRVIAELERRHFK